jgi:hypothetical protein
MKKTVIGIVAALTISLAAIAPANAQFYGGWGGPWGGYYGGYGYGGWGYGGYGAALGIGAGAALLGGVIGGAIASQGYYGGYGGYYDAPRVQQRRNIIIRNSPGARVIEQDIFDW